MQPGSEIETVTIEAVYLLSGRAWFGHVTRDMPMLASVASVARASASSLSSLCMHADTSCVKREVRMRIATGPLESAPMLT